LGTGTYPACLAYVILPAAGRLGTLNAKTNVAIPDTQPHPSDTRFHHQNKSQSNNHDQKFDAEVNKGYILAFCSSFPRFSPYRAVLVGSRILQDHFRPSALHHRQVLVLQKYNQFLLPSPLIYRTRSPHRFRCFRSIANA
jgi:hypothetical protein